VINSEIFREVVGGDERRLDLVLIVFALALVRSQLCCDGRAHFRRCAFRDDKKGRPKNHLVARKFLGAETEF
jgi:hypothetical protein